MLWIDLVRYLDHRICRYRILICRDVITLEVAHNKHHHDAPCNVSRPPVAIHARLVLEISAWCVNAIGGRGSLRVLMTIPPCCGFSSPPALYVLQADISNERCKHLKQPSIIIKLERVYYDSSLYDGIMHLVSLSASWCAASSTRDTMMTAMTANTIVEAPHSSMDAVDAATEGPGATVVVRFTDKTSARKIEPENVVCISIGHFCAKRTKRSLILNVNNHLHCGAQTGDGAGSRHNAAIHARCHPRPAISPALHLRSMTEPPGRKAAAVDAAFAKATIAGSVVG